MKPHIVHPGLMSDSTMERFAITLQKYKLIQCNATCISSCWKEGMIHRRREEALDNYLRREKEEVEAEEADISCSHSSLGS